MNEAEFYAYHIVTRKKCISDKSFLLTKSTQYSISLLFEREQLNASGEDGIQILNKHYKNNELHINNENTKVVMSYMDQTIRAVRETIVEMVRLQEFPEYPSRLSCLYLLKAMRML